MTETLPALKKWHAECILTFSGRSLRGWLEALDETIRWEAADDYTPVLRAAVAARVAYLEGLDAEVETEAELSDAKAEVARLKEELAAAQRAETLATRRRFEAGTSARAATAAWNGIVERVVAISEGRVEETPATAAHEIVQRVEETSHAEARFYETNRVVIVAEDGRPTGAGTVVKRATPDDSRTVVLMDRDGERAWVQPWQLVGEEELAFEVFRPATGRVLYSPGTLQRVTEYVEHDAPAGEALAIRRVRPDDDPRPLD